MKVERIKSVHIRTPYCNVLSILPLIIAILSGIVGLIIFLPCYYKVWEVDNDSENSYTKGTCQTIGFSTENIYRCEVVGCTCEDCGNRLSCDYAKDVAKVEVGCCGDSCCAKRKKECVWNGKRDVCTNVCVERVYETCETFCGNDTRYSLTVLLQERNQTLVPSSYCNFDDYDCKNMWNNLIFNEVNDCYYDSRENPVSKISWDSKFHRRNGVYAGFVFASIFWLISIISFVVFLCNIDFGFTMKRVLRKSDVEIIEKSKNNTLPILEGQQNTTIELPEIEGEEGKA